jgi:hypothetical protein
MEIPQGKAWKIAENRTLKWGSSPPRAEMLTFKSFILKNLRFDAAICRANSLPIPDEAPVTSAQGPNLFLSSAALIFLLRSACLGLVVS